MKTQIKQWGDSNVIVLSKDFMNFHNAEVNDWIDISDAIVIKSETIKKGSEKKEVEKKSLSSSS